MLLTGKRVAILAENLYQEMELWVPYYRLKEEGAEVHIVGTGGATAYASKHGVPGHGGRPGGAGRRRGVRRRRHSGRLRP